MKKYFQLLYICFLIGCSNSSNEKNGEKSVEPFKISFDLENLSENGSPMMSDVIDSLEYIKLEYNPKFLIGFIADYVRPHITNDYIFIYCSHDAGILQYKRNGEFVRKIGSYGRGAGEYLQLRGFVIDEKMGIIYTIPNWKKSIGKFDYHSGKFLSEIPIVDLNGQPISENNIYNLSLLCDNYGFANLYGGNRTKMEECDIFYTIDMTNGRIVHRERSKIYGTSNLKIDVMKSAVMNSLFNFVWYDSRNRLNYWESLNDTIYLINADNTIKPRIIVNYGQYKPDKRAVSMARNEEQMCGNNIMLQSFYESPRYLFFNHLFDGKKYILSVFDKTSGNQYLLKSLLKEEYKTNKLFFGLYNDIDGGFSNMIQYDKDMWFRSYSATKMITILTPEHFEKIRSKVKYPERLDKLKEFVSSLDENDNPIFVIAHLKHN